VCGWSYQLIRGFQLTLFWSTTLFQFVFVMFIFQTPICGLSAWG